MIPRLRGQRHNIALAAILILAGFLRFYRLGYKSLWYDEAWSITLAAKSLREAIREVGGQIYPPLYQLLLHLWVKIFGTSEAATRSLSALFGLAAVGGIYWLTKRIANRQVAMVSALLLSISPFHLEYSQEARGYSLLLLLSLLSFGSLLSWFEGRSPGQAVVHILSTALSFYTHPYAFLLPLAQGLIWLMKIREERSRWRSFFITWLLFLLFPLLLFLPILPTFLRAAAGVSRDFWIPEPSWDEIWTTIEIFVGQGRWSLAALGLMLTIGLGSLLAYEGRERFRAKLYLAWWWLPILTAFAFSNLAFSVYQAKYLIFASVPIFLIAAEGIIKLEPRLLRLAALALVLAAHIGPLADYYRRPKIEEWRTLSHYLKEKAGRNDLVLVYEENEYDDLWRPLSYYGGVDTTKLLTIDGVSDVKRLRARGRNIWLVITHVGEPDSVARIRKRLELKYRLQETREFPGISLQRYALRPSPKR